MLDRRKNDCKEQSKGHGDQGIEGSREADRVNWSITPKKRCEVEVAVMPAGEYKRSQQPWRDPPQCAHASAFSVEASHWLVMVIVPDIR